MELTKTATEIIEALNEANEKKPSAYDTTAEVKRVEGSTAWVHIPGGVDETPAALTIDAAVGDTVQIRVADGNAWITGNQTAPPTSDKTANEALKLAAGAAKTVERGLVSDTLYYLASDQDSGVTVDTPGWTEEPQEITEALPYLWIYHLYTYADGRTETTEPCIVGVYGPQGEQGDPGDPGDPGTPGVSVTKVEPQYYLSLSDQSATGGSWSNSLPSCVSGRFYWTRDKITYSNGTTGYSTATYSPGLTESVQLSYNTAQHFWTRNVTSPGSIPNGAYVTEQTESSYLSNPTGGATLIRSDKVDILVGNKPYSRFDGNGTHIYEGTGTPANPGRELATFSGAGICFRNQKDIEMFNVGYSMAPSATGQTSVFLYSNETTFVMELPWTMWGNLITLRFYKSYPDNEVTGISTSGHYSVDTTTPKVTLDSTLCSSMRANDVKYVAVGYTGSADNDYPFYILGTTASRNENLGAFAASIGTNNRPEGERSLCIGESNLITDFSGASIAAGYHSEARAYCCYAFGEGVIAGNNGYSKHEFAIGEYNTRDTTDKRAFVIGNGSGETSRSDAFSVSRAGAITAGGLPSGLTTQKVDSSFSNVSANSAAEITKTVTKSGYYPLGVVGFSVANGALVMRRCYLSAQSAGSCTVTFNVRNVSSSAVSSSDVSAWVLWVIA